MIRAGTHPPLTRATVAAQCQRIMFSMLSTGRTEHAGQMDIWVCSPVLKFRYSVPTGISCPQSAHL